MAASTIGSGVGKSGSPAPKPITSRPAALSALALASTARVADSLIEPIRDEMRGRAGRAGMRLWSRTALARVYRIGGCARGRPAGALPRTLAGPVWSSPGGGGGSPGGGVGGLSAPPLRSDVHWRVRFGLRQRGRSGATQGSSSIGRVPVSKTGGWGFESLLPCEVPVQHTRRARSDGRAQEVR